MGRVALTGDTKVVFLIDHVGLLCSLVVWRVDLEKFSFELCDKCPHSWGVGVPDNEPLVLFEPVMVVNLGSCTCLQKSAVWRDHELGLNKGGEHDVQEQSGQLTTTAAKAMEPGVMDLSSQVRAFPLGPDL